MKKKKLGLCHKCEKLVQLDSLRRHNCREPKIKNGCVSKLTFSTHNMMKTHLLTRIKIKCKYYFTIFYILILDYGTQKLHTNLVFEIWPLYTLIN
jgi:hypothetical protein